MSEINVLDQNYPTMKRLREEAPGTYKHSQALATMAEAVANAIGIDPHIMAIASMYHDVGKLFYPLHFSENQDATNIHDTLPTWISALLINRHVSDSVALLTVDPNIPTNVLPIIAQHHGSTVMTHLVAKEKALRGTDIPESEVECYFRYKTTGPTSIEAAVLMICDSTEATVRSMSYNNGGAISPETIVAAVDTTVQRLIDYGQMDNVVTRLGALREIKRVIVGDLRGFYHKRVSYGDSK